jgi:hypothetical protein
MDLAVLRWTTGHSVGFPCYCHSIYSEISSRETLNFPINSPVTKLITQA